MKIPMSHTSLLRAYEEAAAIALDRAAGALLAYMKSNLCTVEEVNGLQKSIDILTGIQVGMGVGSSGRPYSYGVEDRN